MRIAEKYGGLLTAVFCSYSYTVIYVSIYLPDNPHVRHFPHLPTQNCHGYVTRCFHKLCINELSLSTVKVAQRCSVKKVVLKSFRVYFLIKLQASSTGAFL